MSEPTAADEQLAFLLESLDDLEREWAAGDIDEHDYLALRDDYTARSAALLRASETGTGATAEPRSRTSYKRNAVLAAGAVVVFAVLAGMLVAQSAGRREPGEVITGGVRQSVTEKLNEAGRRGGAGELDAAIALYDEVLAVEPDNAEAQTYRGWMLTLSGDDEEGLTALLAAATEHPSYPDVHAFLAIVFLRNGLVAQADREMQRLDALNPPPAIRELTANLRDQIDRALSSNPGSSTTAPPATTAP